MEQQKKILYVHHSRAVGGAQRSLSFLLDQMDSSKYSISVLCIFKGKVLELFEAKPIDLIVNDSIFPFHGSTVTGMSFKIFLSNILRLPSSLIAAYRQIIREKPDILHLNSTSLFVVALAAKIYSKKIKVVCHVREPLLKNSFSAFVIKHMNHLLVDHFIAIDHFTGASMKVKGNMTVIYNSVDFREYHPLVKSSILSNELSLHSESVIFLYLARIVKGNGALELIEAASKLKEEFPQFKFVLAGLPENTSDTYANRVKLAAKSNNNVYLMPYRNDITNLIASSHVLIVPFTEPHFARSIVEAAAMSKPTIGANVGGVNELIVHGKTGYLYETLGELVQYCVLLGTSEELRREMGERSVKLAKEIFDSSAATTQVMEVYEQLLS
ncbi:glycosyltransferase family 4 protein [Dyadobacter sp. CY343]|uniref:glycosyltransferase family 4 protein n=1 Tax=Dyadobacter sp. CY343 TaxID=2907299 RepID=UPI001F3AB118|nr:glycosyltransferase family 4 protein [Dyadobacter sp. CY343]MCE7059706.1 glycosyltransferase family 4 protein [Dyadobacter sp. CY343]